MAHIATHVQMDHIFLATKIEVEALEKEVVVSCLGRCYFYLKPEEAVELSSELLLAATKIVKENQ